MYAATLLVDASWCPETGAAGYGYWIASDRGKLGGGDSLQKKVSSSNVAEMQAIVNAIAIAIKRGFVHQGETALVQTDCQAAILGLQGRRELNCEEAEAQRIFREITRGSHFVLRHVKGHTGRKEARFSANRHCDIRAREAMRKARSKIHLQDKAAD
jgi:ribonuclease HI